MSEIHTILSDIKKGSFLPIYFLMGEEPYFINKIAETIEKNALSTAEKEFNQTVLYGRDTSVEEIVLSAKRYPMMAKRQVLIIREAQALIKTIENLVTYVKNPQLTTVLVIQYKYKKLDRRKLLYKALTKMGVVYESKKLYENQVFDWINTTLAKKKYQIEPQAIQILVTFLGTDLGKIIKELEKLTLVLTSGSTITPADIEENIGVSKEFNNFELLKSLGEKQLVKANQIINYFAENPRNNPLVVTLALLNGFFTKVLLYHGLRDKSKNSVAGALKVVPYFVKDYIVASKNYPARKVSQIIGFLRTADLHSKGVGVGRISTSDILRELVFKILH